MRHPLTFRWVVCIITKYEITSTRPMYENEFEFNNEFYSTNLDEMYSYEMCEHYEYHIIINTRCMIPTRWMMSTHEIHTMCRNSHIVIMHNHVRDMCVYTYHNTCYNIRTHRIRESCTHTNAL